MNWSTAILAVGQAGILPAVARKTTGKMPVGPTGWKPVPRPAYLLFNKARWLLISCALYPLVVERVDGFTRLDVFFAERIETLIAKTNCDLPLFARIARKR
jgi:hypothetical protein